MKQPKKTTFAEAIPPFMVKLINFIGNLTFIVSLYVSKCDHIRETGFTYKITFSHQ